MQIDKFLFNAVINEHVTEKNQKQSEKQIIEFSWSDDELQLLLEASLEFKAQSDSEGVSWEWKRRSNYEKIKYILCEHNPDIDDDDK